MSADNLRVSTQLNNPASPTSAFSPLTPNAPQQNVRHLDPLNLPSPLIPPPPPTQHPRRLVVMIPRPNNIPSPLHLLVPQNQNLRPHSAPIPRIGRSRTPNQ